VTSPQRSFSGRWFQGGIAPRPFDIFQKISPSVSFWTASEVQFAGFGGGSAAAAGPSPLPPGPWHETQFVSTVFFALPIPFTGFFSAFASGGATQGPWAETTTAPAETTRVIAATAMPTDFSNALMTPPLVRTKRSSQIANPFNTRTTKVVKQLFGDFARMPASRSPPACR